MADRKERKVVTVLFADLVGFTSRAETMDPEDVEALLRPYHERLRGELEHHGGTVEKFIGDAVMAVFGAPVAREDDPERAVRAALAIRDWAIDEDELEVRIAVNTGEALVSLDARPESGEGMVAGDVVNTASRLQAAAPVNGIFVGEQTQRATSHVIDYRGGEPVEAKGKAELIPVWEAVQATARLGVDVRQLARAELVGREEEIQAIRDSFEQVLEERQPRAVTLVGVPGIGKSRLVYELFRIADQSPELLYWRQGRCLPYGDGVTFWALAEVTKAQAGILDSDSSEEAGVKLRRAVREAVGEGGDAEWVLNHLRPLVGLTADAGESRQAESFFAWRRFLEAVAEERPFVLVFEDLHWADERFLDFVEHLLEWVVDVPLFLLCTSRPELLARRPGWTGTLQLAPLSDEQTAALVHSLLEQAVLPAEMQRTLLERAGGNPLYAEEFARMVGERGAHGGELPLPETVQGVIAARLDGLPAGDKELLQNGAVVGKIFWTGAVASLAGEDRWALEERLQGLARRDFLRRERRSSVEGESEYAFLHVLVRDVAYGSIPRADRAEKHRLAAEWLEALSDDRVEDRAELLAHHYGEALGLARASAAAELAHQLEEPARRHLIMAGDRAFALDPTKAGWYYQKALDALGEDDPERARVSVKVADAVQEEGRLHEAVAGYEGAIPILRRQGDVQSAGGAMVRLALALWRIGETARSRAVLEDAVQLLEQEPVGPNLVRAYARTATNHVLAGRSREGLEWTSKALPLAEKLGLQPEVVRLLQMRGLARQDLGESGVDDLRRALALGLEHGLGFETATSYTNLAEGLHASGGPAQALELLEEAIAFARQHGLEHHLWWTRSNTAIVLFDLGRWDEALQVADEVVDWDRRRGGSQLAVAATMSKAIILAFRGELDAAGALLDDLLPKARAIEDLQTLAPALTFAALVSAQHGELAVARALLEEADERMRESPTWQANLLVQTAYVAAAVGAHELAARQIDGPAREARSPSAISSIATARAIMAEAGGDLRLAADLYRDAAERWREFGGVVALALCLLGLGRCSVRLGETGEATTALVEARELFVKLDARVFLAEVDGLLEETKAAAS
jgi:class 3 adenylate cyclase/tetratricopeptide (TPR) repeat protein